MNKAVLNYIEGDETALEGEPIRKLVQEREVNAYKHYGFWRAMDTMTDKRQLDELWNSGKAPWRIWDE